MKPKILIVSDNFPPEIIGSYRTYDIAMNLEKAGFEVTVLAPHPTSPFGSFKRTWRLKTTEYTNGVKVIRLWAWQPRSRNPGPLERSWYYLTFTFSAVLWVLVHHNFEVIITSGGPSPFPFFSGLISKRLFRKKWIVDVRDLFVDRVVEFGFLKKGGLFEKLTRGFEKVCYSKADRISVVTRRLKEAIVLTYKIEGNKIAIIQNGVDTDMFCPYLITKKRQLVYTGNIGHAHDLEDVILAMKEIAKYDVTLLIVGGGDCEERIKRLVKEGGLDKRVIFAGLVERSKIPKILSESLVAFASIRKLKTLECAVPTKVYAYMACGVPVVGCGSSELRDLIDESGAGMFVDNNPHAIAEATIHLLNNPKERDEMGKNGRGYAKKYCDIKLITRKLIDEVL